MSLLKKGLSAAASVMMAMSVISIPVYAEGDDEADKAANELLAALAADGYAEVGSYKVEKIKDNIYHMDEGTKALPGGASDEDGNMNNPSSIYFVTGEEGVLMVDLGNPVTAGSEAEANVKEIVTSIVGEKPLSIITTHSHGDHTGLGRSEAVFEGLDVEKVYVSEKDIEASSAALAQFTDKIVGVSDETLTVYGTDLEVTVVGGHTEGALMIVDRTHQALFTGDTFGSGFVWELWGTNNGNPLAALNDGVAKARTVMNEMPSASILCGHRWQQFWDQNPERPNEMTIQYFNDMSQVISGLLNGTTVQKPYTAASWAPDAIELSSNGAKAKIDTLPEYVEAYKASVNAVEGVYVYSASDKLSIDSVNSNVAATFVIFPDGYVSDDEAAKYLEDSGLKEILDRSASKAYIARPSNGQAFTAEDVAVFKTIMSKIYVCANLKLIGIGNGATFVNQNLTGYMNFVSGVALINPEEGSKLNASVPAYLVTDNEKVVDAYVSADSAVEKSAGHYANPDSHYEIVVVNKDTKVDAAAATKEAWEEVLKRFGRIGNYVNEDEVDPANPVYKKTATWYSRPLISGDDAYDQARKYQYFDSVDAIDNMNRTVVTQDLDGDGIDSLWYEYVPDEVVNAEKGTVPAVVLLHGNTNDPRMQYDNSGWANVASEEGIILICPEWQGHTFQGYTYDPMTDDDNTTPDSDLITMLKLVEEKYPQIDTSRIYVSGLSRGSRNTTNNGLVNPKYFAAGAGHSGPFGADETLMNAAKENADTYDMPIIFFTGDADEYCKSAFDTTNNNGGFQVATAYAIMNDMPTLEMDANQTDIYGVPWTSRYTIEADAENIAKIIGGTIENEKGIEISMNRILGWGHWNYNMDARLMWKFMSKYARNTETGESIRLDKKEDDDPKPTEPGKDDDKKPGDQGKKDTGKTKGAKTGDSSNAMYYGLGALAALLIAVVGGVFLKKNAK